MNVWSGSIGFLVGLLGAVFFSDAVSYQALVVVALVSIFTWYSGSRQIDIAQEKKEAGWQYDPQILRLAFFFGLILYVGGAVCANASIWWLLWQLLLKFIR
jgi:hypothetical protein